MLLKLMAYTEALKHDVKKSMVSFKQDIQGATAIEYGLIAGGISLAIVTAVFLFGDSLSSMFSTIADKMAEAEGKVGEEGGGEE